jgi:hypothetical protein
MAPTVMPPATIGVAMTVLDTVSSAASVACWKRGSRTASITMVVRCLRATSPTNPVPTGISAPTSRWPPPPIANRQRRISPSVIHSEPPSAPRAAITRSNTLGSSSSKSREALNSREIECSRRRRSTSWRNSSTGPGGTLSVSCMGSVCRAVRACVRGGG